MADDTPQDIKPVSVGEKSLTKYREQSASIHDAYEAFIEELFRIDNPGVTPLDQGAYAAELSAYREHYLHGIESVAHGAWYYYPWLNALVHVLPEDDYYRLRTARNRDLITLEEQKAISQARLGVGGLSVGSSALAALAHTGVKHFKIADADTLSLSNLNRLRSGVTSVGLPKVVIAARALYELDPYTTVEIFDQGLSAENLEEFMDGLDVAVDEMDDVTTKTQLRLLAKRLHIPVVMATDNGDNVLVDIERFDEDPSLDIFHGLLSQDDIERIIQGGLSRAEFMQYALKIIDVRHTPLRLLQSVPKIGTQLAGIPQLGGAAMMAGGVVAYVVRHILNGAPLKLGKHHLNVESLLREDYSALFEQQMALLKQLQV